MDVLIAEDDDNSRDLLRRSLEKWGYGVVTAPDGTTAWGEVQRPDAPRLLILDWMMPGLSGPQLCRLVREAPGGESAYIILLTARSSKREMVEGLECGADDYVVKPFDRDELRARVRIGARVAALQQGLTDRVRMLQGMLPLCAYCRRVRDDGDYWRQIEAYVERHSDARFSHGICPECIEVVMPATAPFRPPSPSG